MSVEMLSPAGEPGRQAARKHDRALRTVLAVLDDGTAFYAPIGEVITDTSSASVAAMQTPRSKLRLDMATISGRILR